MFAEKTPRKIVIDGSMAKGGGGFTYLVNIIPELSRQAPEDRFKVVLGHEALANAIPDLPNVEIEYLGPVGLRKRVEFTYGQAARLARDWDADLYFSASDWLPPALDCPGVVALRNPNVFTLGAGESMPWQQKLRLRILRGIAQLSARVAERVMFVSEDSAEWIGDAIGLPEEKRAVIHHGIDVSQWQDEPPETSLHSRPFILSVSSVYPYKNYVRLIEAYTQMARRNPDVPDLVIIGDNQDEATMNAMYRARDAAGDFAEWIHILGEVPYAEIREYYREACMFVFPSYLETFGHPLLEAMAANVPLVAADIPVFREIAEDAAVYADPFSIESLAQAMETVLTSETGRRTLVKRGRDRLEHFTWTRSASALLAMFGEILDDRDRSQPAKVRPLRLPDRRETAPPTRIAARVASAPAT